MAGVVVAAMIFALIFTSGFAYLLYQEEGNKLSYGTDSQYLASKIQVLHEGIAFCAEAPSARSCMANTTSSSLYVRVNDTGSLPVSVMSWFVRDSAGQMVTPGIVNLTVPLNLDAGYNGTFALGGYTYPGGIIQISLLTSRGNVFTQYYPMNSTRVVGTITTSTSNTETGPTPGGGNSLVVVMAATPVQVFSGTPVTDNVTVFNYSNETMYSVSLVPSVPANATTGTATLTGGFCEVPSNTTIPAYSQSGLAPSITFVCTYTPHTGTVGGLASFTGGAVGNQSNTKIYSAEVTSNLVQIGGFTNVLAQGVFTSNFFFFKYSSCTNTNVPCATNSSSMPPASPYGLPQASVISEGHNYYVAFYVQLTNNFNSPLPLLAQTFEQFDQSNGNESDWWLVGTNSTLTSGGHDPLSIYYPSYANSTGTPSLKHYPADCWKVDSQNRPIDKNCIYLNPGQSVVITLASCGPANPTWDWGALANGKGYNPSCTSSEPGIGLRLPGEGSATAAFTVVSFWYNNQAYTEDLAFQAVAFIT